MTEACELYLRLKSIGRGPVFIRTAKRNTNYRIGGAIPAWENTSSEFFRNRVDGNFGEKNGHGLFRRYHRYRKKYKYAGFFHTDITNVRDKVFGVAGFGGQHLFINFDSGIIVAINAVLDDFDTAKLVVDAINGKTR